MKMLGRWLRRLITRGIGYDPRYPPTRWCFEHFKKGYIVIWPTICELQEKEIFGKHEGLQNTNTVVDPNNLPLITITSGLHVSNKFVFIAAFNHSVYYRVF